MERTDENWGDEGITFAGIFLLGILTSATPCSLALLIAMISYVGTLQKDSDKKVQEILAPRIMDRDCLHAWHVSCIFCVRDDTLIHGVFLEASTVFYLIAGIILIILGINIFKPFSELSRGNLKEKQV